MNPLALIALLGLGFGTMDAKTAQFERFASEEIASRLTGSEKQVAVTARTNGFASVVGDLTSATVTASKFSVSELPFYTEPWRSTSGHIGRLEIRLNNFTLARLHVQELSADVPNCRYDAGLVLSQKVFRISKSGEGWGWVKLSETDLANYIVTRFPEIDSATVRIFNDVIWIEGTGTFLIARSHFTVIGKLSPGDGRRLMLEDAKVYFDWKRSDPELVKVVLQVLNPVIDVTTDLGLLNAITVKEIRLRDGVLVARGIARIPVKPGDKSTDNKG